MNLYFIIDLAVIALPVLLSFDKKVAFYRRWPAVLATSLIVGVVYVGWDIVAARRGDWSFNTAYAGMFRLAHLPVGELLFFAAVPFSCLFIFEVVGAYFGDKVKSVSKVLWMSVALLSSLAAVFFRSRSYSAAVLVSVAVFLALSTWTPLLGRRQFWMYLGISMLPFLIVNGILTSLPIVTYSDAAIWGIRVYTLPLEDFLYCFSLLGLYGLVYQFIRPLLYWGGRRNTSRGNEKSA